jgi:hypothetical protein
VAVVSDSKREHYGALGGLILVVLDVVCRGQGRAAGRERWLG